LKLKTKLYLLISTFVLFGIHANAQDTEIATAEIKVLSRVQQDRILLRWTADSPTAWKLLNTHGYTLERLTVTRDQKSLTTPERKMLGLFLPDPLEQWEAIIETNDDAAIMAQALYGESFQVTGGNDLQAVVNLSGELQQRFSFALFTADQNFEVAIKAGLGYIDKDINI